MWAQTILHPRFFVSAIDEVVQGIILSHYTLFSGDRKILLYRCFIRAQHLVNHLVYGIAFCNVLLDFLCQFIVVPKGEVDTVVGNNSLHRAQAQFLGVVVEFLVAEFHFGSNLHKQCRNREHIELCLLQQHGIPR